MDKYLLDLILKRMEEISPTNDYAVACEKFTDADGAETYRIKAKKVNESSAVVYTDVTAKLFDEKFSIIPMTVEQIAEKLVSALWQAENSKPH